ncbi:A1pp-domain-containing protein [Multifurca ochricompacta]|uniref:A1pp-domain-containing protein n=1 Tax=Multifurca ochricompacta TaxID=376703 RepID=A0AAD4QPW1_9AGAM|nr:A1pp-domain-containing protein [Multifurca ochricompacta]
MAKVVSLQQIPTLRELYQRALIATLPMAEREARFPFAGPLLDRVSVYRGDITHVQVDAIVNAANTRLLGGGGVDGAIHRAAGPKLLKECRTLGGCPVGEARVTAGHNLPAKHVIHAVGPVYHPKDTRAPLQLAGCYRISLQLAVQHELKHILSIESATRVALGETRKFLDTDDAKEFERIIFVVFSAEDEAVYLRLIPEYFPWEPPAPLPSYSSATPYA